MKQTPFLKACYAYAKKRKRDLYRAFALALDTEEGAILKKYHRPLGGRTKNRKLKKGRHNGRT